MTKVLDPTQAIRKASSLRALCLSLPHVPTPAERARLRRFDELIGQPESATDGDIEALATGWRRWWHLGETERLRAMAARVPAALVAVEPAPGNLCMRRRGGDGGMMRGAGLSPPFQ